MWVITFDIDGTMEFGEPNGILTRQHVLGFRSQGAIVGSASDRPESTQLMLWRKYGIELDFVVLKHRMAEIKEQYPDAEAYWHVGDRPLDQMTARQAGFTFFWPDQFPTPEEYLEQTIVEEDTLEEAAMKIAAEEMNGHTNGFLKDASLEAAIDSLDGKAPRKRGPAEYSPDGKDTKGPASSAGPGFKFN